MWSRDKNVNPTYRVMHLHSVARQFQCFYILMMLSVRKRTWWKPVPVDTAATMRAHREIPGDTEVKKGGVTIVPRASCGFQRGGLVSNPPGRGVRLPGGFTHYPPSLARSAFSESSLGTPLTAPPAYYISKPRPHYFENRWKYWGCSLLNTMKYSGTWQKNFFVFQFRL